MFKTERLRSLAHDVRGSAPWVEIELRTLTAQFQWIAKKTTKKTISHRAWRNTSFLRLIIRWSEWIARHFLDVRCMTNEASVRIAFDRSHLFWKTMMVNDEEMHSEHVQISYLVWIDPDGCRRIDRRIWDASFGDQWCRLILDRRFHR